MVYQIFSILAICSITCSCHSMNCVRTEFPSEIKEHIKNFMQKTRLDNVEEKINDFHTHGTCDTLKEALPPVENMKKFFEDTYTSDFLPNTNIETIEYNEEKNILDETIYSLATAYYEHKDKIRLDLYSDSDIVQKLLSLGIILQ